MFNLLQNMKNKKVCAVIVTYNRKKLLINCINSVLKQEYPVNKIIIIDNNSSDGTENYLRKNFDINNILFEYIRLKENLGGAGGFYIGTKLGYKLGFDWLWLMDDDGMPDKSCLKRLLSAYEDIKYKCLAPLVVSIDNEKELSFGLYNSIDRKVIKNVSEIKNKNVKYIFGEANPFNGILIHRDVFSDIGFPKKEMFIWGDETEYLLRMKKNNYDVVTVVDAVHKHPKNKKEIKSTFFGLREVTIAKSDQRNYIRFRNYAYINKLYYSNINSIKYFIKYMFYFLITDRLNFKLARIFINAFLDGIKGDFSKNNKYS